ncbi:hypothetical protein BCR36DRAFT_585023 [Piromyces finnis]|uniref:Chitin-binding type-1 domain-containing protein n=1 Tax=Piromyces finnis TaxID=1754191 RepID=A0A1Y1V493_9FUNG|nr:hypothetical protein BCR36DRAFT_585023 [Piromyces finnis]|eukprot:ORX46919.1 hypothetical protein BCR36DRAFT_585023 [Piromyces finnis]
MEIKSIVSVLLLNIIGIRGVKPLIPCGSSYGSCQGNYCCSKNGYCGTTNDYCNVSKGCQIGYGLCYQDTVDNTKQCGKGKGICANGNCCSKYGYCGISDSYCNIANGCQIDYGLCYSEEKDITRCGIGFGSCPENQCCSKQGTCGSSDDHCNINKGCQLNYGLCYDTPENDTPTTQKCGPNFGVCPDNQCCSSKNTCGETDDHCNLQKGCQNAYGLCYEDDNGSNKDDNYLKECGPDYGMCTEGKCCSKDGKCGTEDSYCNIKKGCQVDYGLCYTPSGNIREGSGKSCGRNYGSCDFPECCSKSGKCVLGNNECLESNGCQNSYGICLSQS